MQIKSEIGMDENIALLEYILATDKSIISKIKRLKIFRLCFGILVLTLLLLFFDDGQNNFYRLATILALGFIVYTLFFLDKWIKKRAEKEALAQKYDSFIYEFNEEEIKILYENKEKNFEWQSLKYVRVQQDYLIIKLITNNAIIINIDKQTVDDIYKLFSILSDKIEIDDLTKLNIVRRYKTHRNIDSKQLDDDFKNDVYETYSDSDIKNWEEKERKYNKKLKKEHIVKKIKSLVTKSAVILYIIFIFTIYFSGYVHYKTVDDQRNAFAGRWVACNISEEDNKCVEFNYDTVSKVMPGLTIEDKINKWIPFYGIVKSDRGDEYRMKTDETITNGKFIYKKVDN